MHLCIDILVEVHIHSCTMRSLSDQSASNELQHEQQNPPPFSNITNRISKKSEYRLLNFTKNGLYAVISDEVTLILIGSNSYIHTISV